MYDIQLVRLCIMKQGKNNLNFKSRNVNIALPNCPRYNKEMSSACVLSLQHADIYSMLVLEVARLDISLRSRGAQTKQFCIITRL